MHGVEIIRSLLPLQSLMRSALQEPICGKRVFQPRGRDMIMMKSCYMGLRSPQCMGLRPPQCLVTMMLWFESLMSHMSFMMVVNYPCFVFGLTPSNKMLLENNGSQNAIMFMGFDAVMLSCAICMSIIYQTNCSILFVFLSTKNP